MTLVDRIKGLASSRRPSDVPVQPQVLYLSSGIGVAIIQWNEYIAAEQAMCHPVVWRALDKVAGSVQQVGWRAQIDERVSAADRANKSRVVDKLNEFLTCPHDELSPASLRYWFALNYAVYGRVPYKVGMSRLENLPNGIYPLEARYVYAKHNTRGQVTSYRYGNTGEEITYPSRLVASNGQSFVWQTWKPGLRGYQHKDERNSPLGSIGLPAQVVKSLLIRAINTAEGHPNVRYLVTTDKTLTAAQKDAVRKHLNEDHSTDGVESGKIPILSNVPGMQIHKLDNDLSDIHSKMPADDMTRLIFGAFGIPLALAGIGAADAAKFAGNFGESRSSFWEDTIDPMYVQPIFQGLTQSLCPAGVCIKPIYDDVPAMQDRRALKMSRVDKLTFLSTTEKRAMFGLEPNEALPEVTTGPQSTQGAGNVEPSQAE